MRILYLAHRIPYPPNKGDKLRAYHQLTQLARKHEVWCAFFVDDARDWKHIARLAEICHRVAAAPLHHWAAAVRGAWGVVSGATLSESYFRSGRMSRILQEWSASAKFDCVAAFSSSMAHYALGVPANRRVLDLCDLDSEKWREYSIRRGGVLGRIFAMEGSRLAQRELEFVDRFDAISLITNAEMQTLARNAASGPGGRATRMDRVLVVGNGADTNWNQESGATIPSHGLPKAAEIPEPIVGFAGTMDYWPNVDAVDWFARKCWPEIVARRPEARFQIVGRAPVRKVRRLAALRGVEVLGETPDMGRAVRRFAVSVAPLRIARGLQNKVLEAMREGRPVVMTGAAAQGLSVRTEVDCLIADGTQEFALAVLRLLHDRSLQDSLGRSGRAYVAKHHVWTEEMEKFEAMVVGRTDRVRGGAIGVSVAFVNDKAGLGD